MENILDALRSLMGDGLEEWLITPNEAFEMRSPQNLIDDISESEVCKCSHTKKWHKDNKECSCYKNDCGVHIPCSCLKFNPIKSKISKSEEKLWKMFYQIQSGVAN